MDTSTAKQRSPIRSSLRAAYHVGIALVGMALWASLVASGSQSPAAAGQVSPAPDLLWQTMRGLNFRTGEMTPELGQLINGEARVPGYMVPLEDNLFEATEFLLVPYPGACIHVPPPPPNQLVHVTMDGGKTTALRSLYEPVWVQGIVRIGEVHNAYGAVSFFQMTATLIEPYQDRK
jgi:uncharacterized protein